MMKRHLIYGLVGLLSLGGVGGGTFFVMKANEPPVTSTTEPDDDEPILSVEPETAKDRFMNNLIASNLEVHNLDVGINTGAENIDISFTGALSYDGLELAKGNFEALKASGDLNLKVMDFDETISFSFPGDSKLYFSYMNKNFSISIDSFSSIIDLIPLFTTPQVGGEQMDESTILEVKKAGALDLDLGSMLDDLTEMLENIVEEETEDGYNYTLNIPDFASIVLSSDKNDMLTGISLVNPINIDGIELTLNASVTAYKDQSFVTGPNGEYQSLDTIQNVVKTVSQIMDSKFISANLNVSAKSISDNTLDLDLHAKLGADISNVSEDFLKGTYELSILPEGIIQGNPQLNEIDIHYSNETIYLKVNELLKGKIQNQTIEDIISLVNQYAGESDSSAETENLLNNLFGGSILMDLIEGDFTGLKSVILDINSTSEKLEVIFSDRFLNSKQPFSIAINFNQDDVKSIQIKDFTISDFEINLELKIEKSFSSAAIFEDLSSFKDYKIGASIYRSIAEILDTYQFNSDYEISLKHRTDVFTFAGEIAADLNGIDFNNIETLFNGQFKFSADVTYGEKTKAINAQLQDETLYLTYNNVIANSLKGKSLMDMIDVISSKFATVPTSEGDKTGVDVNEILALLSLNIDEYSKIIEEVMKFNFTSLNDYVLIDDGNTNEDIITIKILPSKNSETYMYVEVATDSTEITSLKLQNIHIGEAELSLTLNLRDYADFKIQDTSIYQPLDSLLGNVANLVNTTKFNVGLDGSILTDDGSMDPITLSAAAQFDIETTEFYGNLDLSAKLPIDKNIVNHHIAFDNYFVGEDDENELLFKYYTNNQTDKPLRASVCDGEFGRCLDVIQNIPEDNSLMFIISLSTDITISMPLLDIINGEYGLLFNDYLKVFNIGASLARVEIDGSLFDLDTTITLEIEYSDTEIHSIKIVDLKALGMTINLKITLNKFDENLSKQRLSVTEPRGKYTYINGNNLDLFLQIGINTTQSRRFHLFGTFNLTLPETISNLISDIAIYSTVDMKLVIDDVDGSVNAIIDITKCKSNGNAYSSTEAGYKRTEFFIQSNNDCIVRQTRVTSEGGFLGIGAKKYSQYDIFRVTQSEMVNNLHYYLLKYTFGMNDLVFDPINEAVVNPTTDSSGEVDIFNFDYQNIIQVMEYNEFDSRFTLKIDLGSIIKLENVASVITQDSISISFSHDKNYILSNLRIEGEPIKIVILGMSIALGVYLDVSNDTSNSFTMHYFNDFCNEYYANQLLVNLGYYEYRLGNTGAIYTSNKVQL